MIVRGKKHTERMNKGTDLTSRRNYRHPCKKKGLILIATSSREDGTEDYVTRHCNPLVDTILH